MCCNTLLLCLSKHERTHSYQEAVSHTTLLQAIIISLSHHNLSTHYLPVVFIQVFINYEQTDLYSMGTYSIHHTHQHC